MIFHSGAKLRRFKFTVRPASTVIVHGPNGPVTEQVKPLRAIFKYGNDHTFDSVAAQNELGWTDAERELVEQKLLDPNNGYMGKFDERRIYRADVPQEVEVARDESGEVITCKGYSVVNGQGVYCSKPAIPGGLYCDEHLPIASPTNAVPVIATCRMDIAAEGEPPEPCGKPVIEGTDCCQEHEQYAEPVPVPTT